MSIRKVALGSTFEVNFNTTQFSTGAPDTLDSGAMELRRYGNDTEITAGLTFSGDHDAVVGFNEVTVVAATAGLVAGAIYDMVVGVGTIDSVSAVGMIVDRFQVETAAELAAREWQEAMYPDHVVATTTGNTTSLINLTEMLVSTATANDVLGEILTVQYIGGTFAALPIYVRITAYATTNQLATVEQLDGTVLPEALAAGDKVWRTGQYTATDETGAALATATSLATLQADVGTAGAGLTALFTTAMTEAYSTDQGTLTLAMALYELHAMLGEFSVSGTTVTYKQRDGSTTATTYTLDSASDPTSTTRAT